MVHLCEILDRVVDTIFLSLTVLSFEIDLVEVVLNIFFTLFVDVRSVDEPQGLDHNGQTAVQALVSDLHKLPSECVQDFNGGLAILPIT